MGGVCTWKFTALQKALLSFSSGEFLFFLYCDHRGRPKQFNLTFKPTLKEIKIHSELLVYLTMCPSSLAKYSGKSRHLVDQLRVKWSQQPVYFGPP